MTDSLRSSAASRRSTGLRSRLLAGFDQDATVTTPGTRVSDGAGGWIDGAPISETVRCQVRFPNSNPRDPLNQAADTTLSRAQIRLPVGTSVSVSSRIVVDGRVYQVKGHDVGRSYASEILCDCVRSDDGGTTPLAPPSSASA